VAASNCEPCWRREPTGFIDSECVSDGSGGSRMNDALDESVESNFGR
jgi:hypothetical protein